MVGTKVKRRKTRAEPSSPERDSGGGVVRPSSPVRERQRWSLIAGGVLMISAFAVMGALLWGSRAAEVEVYVAARDLTAGQELRGVDVTRVMLPASTNVARFDRALVDLEGSVLLSDVGEGTLLNDSLVATADTGAEATMIRVGLLLSPNELPANLVQADTVRVVEVATTSAQQSGLEITSGTSHLGVIAQVEESATNDLWVSVLVEAEVADRITALSALNAVAIAEVG